MQHHVQALDRVQLLFGLLHSSSGSDLRAQYTDFPLATGDLCQESCILRYSPLKNAAKFIVSTWMGDIIHIYFYVSSMLVHGWVTSGTTFVNEYELCSIFQT